MPRKVETEHQLETVDAFHRLGSVRATAKELGLARSTVLERIRKSGADKKPLAGGKISARSDRRLALPPKGSVKRYICTSAQNNTYVNAEFLKAIEALAEHYGARILVGTFTYNQNAYGKLSVKRGTSKDRQKSLWYDPKIEQYICDERLELANGLVWCGEMNIIPTAVDPLSGLETFTHRKSAIFPHAKLSMRSIATMLEEGCKLNFTTGAVTQRNYIQKKEGQKAEHHHCYSALVVEVDSEGHWWVRQVGMGSRSNEIQDLNVRVIDGKVVDGSPVEAITWGDLHATMAEKWVIDQSVEMLDTLRPRYQFLHDVLEGTSINRHVIKKGPDAHYGFYRWLRGLHRFDAELESTVALIERYLRPWCETVVPESNHDGGWLRDWLLKYDYRFDPANAELFLDLQRWMYEQLRKLVPTGKNPKDVPIVAKTFEKFGLGADKIRFLLPDESFTVCGRKIECGMHGHMGPNGAMGSPANMSKIGRRANTAHTHSAGIWSGLYVAGTSSKLKWSYNWGPSAWSHSHIVTYPNGQRSIVTMYAGKWRAQPGKSKVVSIESSPQRKPSAPLKLTKRVA